jgi:signal transduction histidine kinase
MLLLMTFLYVSSVHYMQREADAVVAEEIHGLAERYEISGLIGVAQLVAERVSRNPPGTSVYLLARADYTPLQGNLRAWPADAIRDGEWLEFAVAGEAQNPPWQARARHLILPGGMHLLAGRNLSPLLHIESRLRHSLAWGLVLTLLLDAAGGYYLSRRVSHRLETVNRATHDIMNGDLRRRIPVHGSNDEFDRLAGNLNRMLDRIETLMEDVRRVTDNIAHDLRTPLGRLQQQLEQLHEMSAAGSAADALAERALLESEQLLDTFNALLRIARIERRVDHEAFVPVALGELLRDVVEYYEPLAEEREQQLHTEVHDESIEHGDRNLLFQALANLIDNAIKYSPRGGHIVLALSSEEGRSCLRICDDGPGIPANEREHIFQRFYRLDDSRTTPGSGLGLSLVEAVARLHGIDIQIASDNRGVGSCFVLRFPVCRSARSF